MKQQYKQHRIDSMEAHEMELLADQLDSREMFIVGFLKGFNRTTMKEWQKQGIGEYSLN